MDIHSKSQVMFVTAMMVLHVTYRDNYVMNNNCHAVGVCG